MDRQDGRIFLLQPDNSLVPMNETAYEAEELLQRLLADHSDLLAGDQIDLEAPRRFFLVYREIGVPDEQDSGNRWSLDHLFVDQDAVPTFVEVKRATDTRGRREVVAQMLDYAANATIHWRAGLMREKHAETCAHKNLEPHAQLVEFTGDSVEADEFWDLAELNLREGRIRMVFVADVVPPPLRRIVEFLNQQMSPAQVLAIEVRQFIGESQGQELKTLVPRIIGQTEAAKEKKVAPPSSRVPLPIVQVSEFPDVFAPEHRDVVTAVIKSAQNAGWQLDPRSAPKTLRLALVYGDLGPEYASLSSDGSLWITLRYKTGPLSEPETNDRLRQLLIEAAPEWSKRIRENYYVGIPLSLLGTAERQDHLERFFRYIHAAIASTGAQPQELNTS